MEWPAHLPLEGGGGVSPTGVNENASAYLKWFE